jgi:hypothetical protein
MDRQSFGIPDLVFGGGDADRAYRQKSIPVTNN